MGSSGAGGSSSSQYASGMSQVRLPDKPVTATRSAPRPAAAANTMEPHGSRWSARISADHVPERTPRAAQATSSETRSGVLRGTPATILFASGATARAGSFSPGRLYNVGNAIAFFAGITVAVASRSAADGRSPWSAGADYVMGSRSAALMTLATIVFFASGEFYARAFKRGTPPCVARKQTRLADLLSGAGAILLAAALACIGDPILAAASGILNAGGKLGSACLSGLGIVDGERGRQLMAACRFAALLSRLPAVAAALGGLVSARAAGDLPNVVLSVIMLGCYALWAMADALLVGGQQADTRRR